MVKLVQPNFVPVALNADRLTNSESAAFFRQLLKRWPQGLWVVTPQGETLGFHYHQPKAGDNYQQNLRRWADDTVAMLRDAVAKAGELPPRRERAANPFPDRGVGPASGGGVRLAVSVIGLRNGTQDGPPAVDSIHLDAPSWKHFAPPDGQTSWTLPESVAQRFAPAFSALTDSIFVPRPRDVMRAAITAEVLRKTDDVIVIRYRGVWESLHDRDGKNKHPIRTNVRGEGIGVLSTDSTQLQSLIWVLKGTYQNGTAKPTNTAAVVEWSAEQQQN